MPDYYKADVRNLTFGEGWRLTRSPAVLLLWAAKLLRFPMPLPSYLADPVPNREQEVTTDLFSSEGREFLENKTEELRALGFIEPFFYTLKETLMISDIGAAALRHSSGDSFAVLIFIKMTGPPVVISRTVSFVTKRTNGSFISTTDNPRTVLGPPGNDSLNLPKLPTVELWHRHLHRLEPVRQAGLLQQVPDRETLLACLDLNDRLSFEFNRQRGYYIRMTDEEVTAAHRLKDAATPRPAPVVEVASDTAPPPLPASAVDRTTPPSIPLPTIGSGADVSPEDRLILEHMHQLQTKKGGGWGGAVLILIVSIALFLGLGAASWSWEFALLLIPILFFHELGHYVAMRLFGYRNLKMFFIPLFGAAVTGQHYNVPGWKKVIVSLAGPVPGILVGAVVGVIGVITKQNWLLHTAYLTLFINGFNLLPVLPLDGGWVLQATVFSRHHLLNVTFHLVAALALIGGSLFLDGGLLRYVGIFMLLGLPATFRMSKVASQLRARNLPVASEDNQTVPQATAVAIIGELRSQFKTGQSPKSLAQLALTSFENLNARPPGWPASIALLGAHAASFVVAVVFAFFFVVAKQGNILNFLDLAANAPQQTYVCGSLIEWRGQQFAATERGRTLTLVGSFPDNAAVARAWATLTNQLPAEVGARKFGQTLLLALPVARDDLRADWIAKLEAHSTNVFAATTNFSWSLSITCIATNAAVADRIEAQLLDFATAPDPRILIPPWQPDDPRTAGERARHELARRTYGELAQLSGNVYTNAEHLALVRKSSNARRKGDNATAEALDKERQTLDQRLREAAIDRLQTGADANYDAEMIRRFRELPDRSGDQADLADYLTKLAALTPLMGRLDEMPAAAGTDVQRFAGSSGFALRSGMIISINYARLESPYFGVPALANWLCEQGCLDLKYEIHSSGFTEPNED